ncbi:hypothetical protein K2173_027076 [Erythroxylum novogranatense]|uniref:LAZY1 n=1 Tax=Erythroxylum novogranatense TaxID=1862640 RepID=A0AAV8U1B8_9ROSI|nr:hypothetical protein K2173_027076 [Erythroxylum novogranatense]
MKILLLGWLNGKLRRTSTEPLKSFRIGNHCSCFSAQLHFDDDYLSSSKSSFGSRLVDKEDIFPGVETKGYEETCQETSSVISELYFNGFLAIGTLGSDPITSDPATPTFPMSLEKVGDEKAEVTKTDLKLINLELEKFLESEADQEEIYSDSLARSSYVSTITISGMQIEGPNNGKECGKGVICPLQGYLFGSSIELPETNTDELEKYKTSLGDMFRRTKFSQEISLENDGERKLLAKPAHKWAKYLMKKMMRKLHSASANYDLSFSGDGSTNLIPVKKKFSKVLKMLQRKIHPEKSADEKEQTKAHKGNMKTNKKSPVERYPRDVDWAKTSNGNREHWIKTDLDYLVLEL